MPILAISLESLLAILAAALVGGLIGWQMRRLKAWIDERELRRHNARESARVRSFTPSSKEPQKWRP